MVGGDTELRCDACGATAQVQANILNSYGIIARPEGWTHGGRGMAVIGAKDYCPDCSPLQSGTPWPEGRVSSSFPPGADGELLAVLVLDEGAP